MRVNFVEKKNLEYWKQEVTQVTFCSEGVQCFLPKLFASNDCCSFLPCSAVCSSLVCSYSALILCILFLSQICYLLWLFSPNQQQYHYGKLVSIGQTFLFCIFGVVFRMSSINFAQLVFFTFFVLSFEKGGKGKTAGNFQSTEWEDVACLWIGDTELACWRHLYVLLRNTVVVRMTPTCPVEISVHASCGVCQLHVVLEWGEEESYKNKCWTRWGRDNLSSG